MTVAVIRRHRRAYKWFKRLSFFIRDVVFSDNDFILVDSEEHMNRFSPQTPEQNSCYTLNSCITESMEQSEVATCDVI